MNESQASAKQQECMTIAEAAEFLTVSIGTIKNNPDFYKPVRVSPKRIIFRRSHLQAILDGKVAA